MRDISDTAKPFPLLKKSRFASADNGPVDLLDADFTRPFKLVINNAVTPPTYQVSPTRSTITNGANGAMIDLTSLGIFDVPVAFTTTKNIVLEADVDVDLVPSGWTFSEVSAADAAEEVRFNGDTPPIQDKLRMYVGSVYTADGVGYAYQACEDAQILTTCFLNGVYYKALSPYRVHPDGL